MVRPYRPYIPESLGDLLDYLTVLLLQSPTFEQVGYFPGKDVPSVFGGFSEGLQRLRPQLGDALYHRLVKDAAQMRAYFEADPNNTTGETRKGKNMVYELEALVEARWREISPPSGK